MSAVQTVTAVRANGATSVQPRDSYWNAYGRVMAASEHELIMFSSVALHFSKIYRNGELFATVVPTVHNGPAK